MNLRAGTRKRVATWMVGVLLLAQWLVSAYACLPAGPGRAGQEVAITSAALHDCHDAAEGRVDAGPGNLALCKAHCQVGDQAANPGSDANLPVSLLPALGWVTFGLPLPSAAPTAAGHWANSGAPPPGWPPLYIVHQALRN